MITFKYGEQETLSKIHSAALDAAYSHARSIENNPMSSIGNTIAQMVGMAVRAGFEEMLRQQYTHDDFEKDLQLKK